MPTDAALPSWFLTDAQRGNAGSDIRTFTTGNTVRPLVHGRRYFAALHATLTALVDGDEVFLAAFRMDQDQLLDGPGTEVEQVLGDVARRGVGVHGLIWRSQPEALEQSERANADAVSVLRDAGAEIMLDARTRRGGSHHQKLVVCRSDSDDVAYVGGIDLAWSRSDDAEHLGDPQVMPFTSTFGERPPWHDVQVSVRGPAVTDLEHTFRERWGGSTVLDLPSPLRMAFDRVRHASVLTSPDLPDPRPDPPADGPHAVQVLRTYPARSRPYPFAPQGERSIAHAYGKALARARALVYVEDQYLWGDHVGNIFVEALRRHRDLRVIAVVPMHPDVTGINRVAQQVGRRTGDAEAHDGPEE